MAMSMQQTKARIKSVASTKKITKAMELVSTAKLKKARDLHEKLTPFYDELMDIISYVATNVTDKDYKYFNEGKSDKSLYIVVTSSLGLCGGYNLNEEKYALELVDREKDDLVVFGSKGRRYFKDKNFNIIAAYDELPGLNVKESNSENIARNILSMFDSGRYKSVHMIYTKFINSLTFEPKDVTLLPLTPKASTIKMDKELLLEPSASEVLDNLVPFYLATSIKSLLFESILSEQASRRTAMENATDNASELEEKLLLEFNKSRQAAITQEITEISGAANAQK